MANRPSMVKPKQSDDANQTNLKDDLFAQTQNERENGRQREHPTYAQMAVHKTLSVYFAKPYSLASCSEGTGRLRFWLLLLLAAAGVAGLALFSHAGAEPVSWAARGALCSLVCLLWGAGIFLFGFARASLIWPVGTALALLWAGGRWALAWAWGRSPVLFAALGVFLFALACGVIRQLIKRLVLSFTATFWQYERNGILRAADLPLEELPPIEGYRFFLRGEVHVPLHAEDEPATAVSGILRDFLIECVYRRLIFCGYALDAHHQQLTFYFYADDAKRAKRAFTRFMRRQGRMAVISYQTDPGWQQFRTEVYPNETEYQRIHNRYLQENMEADGFDFSQEVPQVYIFYFSSEEDARAFAEQSNSLGYEKIQYFDCKQDAGGTGSPVFSHVAYAQLTGRVGLARMDCNTDRAVEQAKQFHGRFYEWEVGEVAPVVQKKPGSD